MEYWAKIGQVVGNKAKGRISKRLFQEKKHAKFSQKNEMFVFRKVLRALFS